MESKDTYTIQKSYHNYLMAHPEMMNVEMTEIYADWREESQILVSNPELASLLLEETEAIKDMDPDIFRTIVEMDNQR